MENEVATTTLSLGGVNIAVVGLGYVGLPLAVEFGKKGNVVGFDIDVSRIESLSKGLDTTCEVDFDELNASQLTYTNNLDDISKCNVFIITVPTPIDAYKRPDLGPLLAASKSVGSVLKPGDIVVYESTVYPGATEDDCVPVLEEFSKLLLNKDFYVGYSPERINPGDRSHSLPNIKKITSGSNTKAADFVDDLYKSIISAGTHKASSIRVAEAAKVIENTQRDVNIALVNELAIIFNKLDIDTQQVLEAAATKWNFVPFSPGLVGGHCIGVDPYYLTHKAQAVGHHPELILAGRRLNDQMGPYIVTQLLKAMLNKQIEICGSRVLIMGLSFKENCPDLRNTRVIDIIRELEDFNVNVDVYDPWVDGESAKTQYGLDLVTVPQLNSYDAIVIAVAHSQFIDGGIESIRNLGREKHIIYDVKCKFAEAVTDLRL